MVNRFRDQIREQMNCAMTDLLQETIQKEAPTEEDVEWLGRLVDECCVRIHNLTPHRADLQASLDREVDVDLLKQMYLHHAFDKDEVCRMSDAVFTRLAQLCDPSQDADVAVRRGRVRGMVDGAAAFVEMLMSANAVVDELERLREPL